MRGARSLAAVGTGAPTSAGGLLGTRVTRSLRGYPVPVRWPTVPGSRGAVCAAAALVVLAGTLAGCATSAPAVLVDTTAPEPFPTATEDLLVDEPAPDTATGTLAEGFPTTLVPVPEGAQILVSSAQKGDDGLMQISLNIRTDEDTRPLLDEVSAPLLAAGFAQSPPSQPDPSLAAQASFARSGGSEFVLVGILDRDGQRTMTLGGTVKP